ncbi:hypothetical protein WICPIJ_009172 [Wickerhamomyces pijperi]|uniref:Uncharacterized protein n=1 Tax=Wickerhamomyces pijperi TaxID=599730 RepID=A0A9P8PRE2_WICPI|nr:hypothetical protein WICPIJ_009172 [Wickerhamomyces pijperi]
MSASVSTMSALSPKHWLNLKFNGPSSDIVEDEEVQEHQVTDELEPTVLQNLSQTQKDINKVHDDKDHVTDSCVEVEVRATNQRDGDDMMCEHLNIVLSLGFDVQNEQLVDPAGQLHQVVSLCDGSHLVVRPANPYVIKTQEV